jgi:hypothetical protein
VWSVSVSDSGVLSCVFVLVSCSGWLRCDVFKGWAFDVRCYCYILYYYYYILLHTYIYIYIYILYILYYILYYTLLFLFLSYSSQMLHSPLPIIPLFLSFPLLPLSFTILLIYNPLPFLPLFISSQPMFPPIFCLFSSSIPPLLFSHFFLIYKRILSPIPNLFHPSFPTHNSSCLRFDELCLVFEIDDWKIFWPKVWPRMFYRSGWLRCDVFISIRF